MTINASSDRVRRPGGWLPERQDDLEEWIAGHRERVEARGEDAALHPVIVEFKELIASDPVVRLYMTEMIEQVPKLKPYRKRHLTSVDQMLRLINEVLTTAPEFSEGGMVTTPLTAILDWTMGTEAGFAAHRDPRIIASACESTPYKISSDVQRRSRFWVKNQPSHSRTCSPGTSQWIILWAELCTRRS
ncbi:phophatidylserine decarboxylase associated domain-containing protein [Arthrobacter bambusae]|uniref:phophatidylserine decarboxylase associated domain-containing protein n=1 Tax=Arthrobacter bambusae TaxID=1338426 RepID=UPI0027813B7F|nr:phophatidylserine decarboxylase associated domain-containing protein [Arthrobacter bambusae]MDQ0240303.1 hypothetical protein [Arthrobacter bambusae]